MKLPVLEPFSVAVLVVGCSGAGTSCQATIPNRNPVGEPLVRVEGQDLDGRPRAFPSDEGEVTICLVGYVQKAQFDADRWLFGLLQSETPARLVELPTIRGLFPRVLRDTIDSGMRSGIPEEDWGTVITLYGDAADRLVKQLGNETPRNIRVLLVDAEGTIRWFHDRGFSAGKLLELDRLVREGPPFEVP